MISKATLRYLRIAPRKFRLIIPLIKGKQPEQAISILMSVKKNASKYAMDLIKSAMANAKVKDQHIDISGLRISNMIVNCGPQMKRFRAGSMGRAFTIIKRTCHVTVTLDHEKRTVTEGGAKPGKVKTHKKEESKAVAGKHEKQHTTVKKHKTKESGERIGSGKKGKE